MEPYTPDELRRALVLDHYPRTSQYDPQWVIENSMGPHVLWLTEALASTMRLEHGMRVLDLGCGKGISSIFLAREFAVEVWAVDLWIDATTNWHRIRGQADARIVPLQADARALPFAHDFFDAIICVDAYHYFGTDDLALESLSRFVRPGGEIGVIVPGTLEEFTGVPDDLRPYWHRDFSTFHSPAWWLSHWSKSGLVDIVVCDAVPEGWKQWSLWCETKVRQGNDDDREQAEMLRQASGRSLGFVRIVASRLEEPAMTWSREA